MMERYVVKLKPGFRYRMYNPGETFAVGKEGLDDLKKAGAVEFTKKLEQEPSRAAGQGDDPGDKEQTPDTSGSGKETAKK